MDFAFIGGSMGAVVGENLKRNQSFYQKKFHL
jgi:acetyl-CoA carboxylase beta subunit